MRGVDKFRLVAASHQPATLCHPKAELKSRLTYLINVYYKHLAQRIHEPYDRRSGFLFTADR